MRKHVLFFILFIVFYTFQISTLQAQETFTTHTVVKGETLSGIAKKFNTTTGELMKINHLNSKSILKIGEKLKIPVPQKTVENNTPTDAVAITTHPIMHTVKKGETLYSISKKFGSSITQLKSWNKLSSDVIVDGKSLIVGFEADDFAPEDNTALQQQTNQQTVADTLTSVTYVPAADTSTIQNKPVDTLVTGPVTPLSMEALFFKNGMGKNMHVLSGNAKTFESSLSNGSRANYILMNQLPAGTIVKITSASGENIFAKVLWKLESIPSNEGLDFRISDTAAQALGIHDPKFALAITYFEQ
ncbi:MAG: LysM peptidoglycan-binding domain-containing protein [Bacteroidetes bacterium]|nr:LysM peptidoglycan-binding domain-containing protein [Bacteroidota bacterium]